MSYRTDQWFRFNDIATGESLSNIRRTESGYAVPGADNQDFIYPARAVRTVDNRGRHITNVLKRGYIRSLLTGDGLPITKCQFQFNPSAINQSVTQNTSILNFLQIDPAQYSQPLPGNVTFQFGIENQCIFPIDHPGGFCGVHRFSRFFSFCVVKRSSS